MNEDMFKIKIKYTKTQKYILSNKEILKILFSDDVTHLNEIYNLFQMMYDRGFTLDKFNKEDIKFKNTETGDEIFYINNISPSVNIDCLKYYLSKINKNRHHFIIVYQKSITNIANKFIKELNKIDRNHISGSKNTITISGNITFTPTDHKVTIETFSLKELILNPTIHILVPKHKSLSEKGSEEFLKKYPKIPLILRSDPISKWYNFKRGRVIEITYPNGEITYRRVTGN
jgi:DNA-directed RNA polymerase subunit H (RpoH/RPB5)